MRKEGNEGEERGRRIREVKNKERGNDESRERGNENEKREGIKTGAKKTKNEGRGTRGI